MHLVGQHHFIGEDTNVKTVIRTTLQVYLVLSAESVSNCGLRLPGLPDAIDVLPLLIEANRPFTNDLRYLYGN